MENKQNLFFQQENFQAASLLQCSWNTYKSQSSTLIGNNESTLLITRFGKFYQAELITKKVPSAAQMALHSAIQIQLFWRNFILRRHKFLSNYAASTIQGLRKSFFHSTIPQRRNTLEFAATTIIQRSVKNSPMVQPQVLLIIREMVQELEENYNTFLLSFCKSSETFDDKFPVCTIIHKNIDKKLLFA